MLFFVSIVVVVRALSPTLQAERRDLEKTKNLDAFGTIHLQETSFLAKKNKEIDIRVFGFYADGIESTL